MALSSGIRPFFWTCNLENVWCILLWESFPLCLPPQTQQKWLPHMTCVAGYESSAATKWRISQAYAGDWVGGESMAHSQPKPNYSNKWKGVMGYEVWLYDHGRGWEPTWSIFWEIWICKMVLFRPPQQRGQLASRHINICHYMLYFPEFLGHSFIIDNMGSLVENTEFIYN